MNDTVTTLYDDVSNASGLMERDNGKAVNTWDDATWILTSSFIIFTMQSGFGLLEAGTVSAKNEVNILVKNVVDVTFGGLSYWLVGYGLSFGTGEGSNVFCGVGNWLVTSYDTDELGLLYSNFIFQLSFTTTATTIVSGAMAERTKLTAYMVFSFFNTLVYCFPAHWIWAEEGFLKGLGVVDVAGSGAVHLLGGSSSLVAAILLKPRLGRFDEGTKAPALGNPTNALIGLFMLWWGWLAFNSGSTYGISGGKWILASRAATTTILASIAGGIAGILISHVRTGKFLIPDIINSILGALVSITASCAVVHPWEAVIIGVLGGVLCMYMPSLIDRLQVDDPIGAFAVHGVGGIWGLLAVGIFVDIDPLEDMTMGRRGLVHGGGFYLLGVQALAAVLIAAWSMVLTLVMLLPLHLTIGIRLSEKDERLGSDFVEHNICRDLTAVTMATKISLREDGTGIHPVDFLGEVPGCHIRSSCCCARKQRSVFGTNAVIEPIVHHRAMSEMLKACSPDSPRSDIQVTVNPPTSDVPLSSVAVVQMEET